LVKRAGERAEEYLFANLERDALDAVPEVAAVGRDLRREILARRLPVEA